MRSFFILIILFSSKAFALSPESVSVWGKIVKTQKKGVSEYYVQFKRENKQHVFPIKSSKISLEDLNGKFAKLDGTSRLIQIPGTESSYTLSLDVQKAKVLGLEDLNSNIDAFANRLHFSPSKVKKEMSAYQPDAMKLSDAAVNSLIFVGGALLATDVLMHIVK